MPQLCLFISCVSNEFGNYRDAMRKDLSRPNLTTKIQEDFIAYGTSTLQKLDEYIKSCEAIIHLCGNMTGSMANPFSLDYINTTYPDFGTRFPQLLPVLDGREQLSYTQWEAWLAAYHKKTLLIAKPNEKTRRNKLYQLDTKQQEHQQFHVTRLRSYGHYDEIHFSTPNELIKKLYQSSLLDLLSKIPATKPINLPYHSIGSLFKGRKNELKKIYSGLSKIHSEPTAIIGNTIHGLGGIGKTRLAVEYAWKHENDYTALLFVTADSSEKLFTNIASLSAKTILDLPEQLVQEEQSKYDAVLQWLQQNKGWLLILDNADTRVAALEVQKLFGKLRGGHVLITSRQANWSRANSLSLEVLDEKAAVSFLLAYTEEKRIKTAEDESLAKLITADLGYLALALEQAGAYITIQWLSFAQYRQAWQTNHHKVLDWYDELQMLYPSSVAITWQTSVNQLSADARLLLDRLAWLAPDPIPKSLLDVQATEEDSFNYYSALTELTAYSLVNRLNNSEFDNPEFDNPEFTVHRLVQDVTRRKQDKEVAKSTFATCLNWINNAFAGDPEDVRSWPVLEPLLPHALALTHNAARQGPNTAAESRLLNQMGLVYLAKAQYKEAEPLMRRALQIDEQSFGDNHPKVAIRLNNLALLLQVTNRLAEAELLMRRACVIFITRLSLDHPNTQTVKKNYILLLQNIGKSDEEIKMILSNILILTQVAT